MKERVLIADSQKLNHICSWAQTVCNLLNSGGPWTLDIKLIFGIGGKVARIIIFVTEKWARDKGKRFVLQFYELVCLFLSRKQIFVAKYVWQDHQVWAQKKLAFT